MIQYLAKKAAILLVSLFLVTTLTFFLMHAIPGDPFVQDRAIPEEVLKALHKHYGLDQPLYVQYGKYLDGVLHFELGPSFKYEGRTVNDIISDGFPVSFCLGMEALLIATFGGVILGSIAALYHTRWQDHLTMVIAVIGISVPSFILASFLQYLLAMQLDLLPVARWGSFSQTIMPAISLAALPMAFIARLTRANMVEVLQQDYIQTARSKGLNSFQVIVRHVVRNALLPVVTYLGPLSAAVMTGSFAIEKIFGIPGLGQWFVSSITNRDYTVIMGTTVFYSAILMLCVFIVDILYCVIDPRIQFRKRGLMEDGWLFSSLSQAEKDAALENTAYAPQCSYWQDAWQRLKRNKSAMFGLVTLTLLIFMAIIGPLISHYTYYETQLSLKNSAPSATFWFGTDELGRDLFTRCWWGARISLFVGITASLVDLVIGVLFGAIAGLVGGKIEEWMMRFADVLYAIPYLLVVILLMVIIGPGIMTIIIALTITGWINMARIVRSQILQIKQQDYVRAAFALGASRKRVLLRHLIPNAMGPIIVTLTLTIPSAIFAEAFLSFLGLGVQAPIASWGTMANDGLPALRYYPWRLFFPAAFISLTMLSFNLLGDGLRDAFDPRLKK